MFTSLNVDDILKGLVWYFFPVNSLSKQKCAMRRCTKNPHSLKVRSYSALTIDLNDYLSSFTVATMTYKIGVTKLNNILSNSTPNSWSIKAYIKSFDCKYISFKKAVNMFEHMKFSEIIYEGVVTHPYDQTLEQNPNTLESLGIRKEKPPHQTLTMQSMGALESTVNNI